jgi:hypothetical protein
MFERGAAQRLVRVSDWHRVGRARLPPPSSTWPPGAEQEAEKYKELCENITKNSVTEGGAH